MSNPSRHQQHLLLLACLGVVLIVAAAAAASQPRAIRLGSQEMLERHWAKDPNTQAASSKSPAKEAATTSFHIFFPLRSTPREGSSSTASPTSAASTVEALKPHEDIVANVHQWIESRLRSGSTTAEEGNINKKKFCSKKWDKISCESVPIKDVEAAFDVTMELMQTARPIKRSTVGPTTQEQKAANTKKKPLQPSFWMAVAGVEGDDHLLSKFPAELFVVRKNNQEGSTEEEDIVEEMDRMQVIVRGILPFDPTLHPKRHKAKLVPLKEDEMKMDDDEGLISGRRMQRSAAAQASSEIKDDANDNDSVPAPADVHNWPMDNTTDAPVLLDVYMRRQQIGFASVALKCALKTPNAADGVVASAAWENVVNGTPNTWCPQNGLYKVPTKVVFSLIVEGSSKTNTPALELNSTVCGPANDTTWYYPYITNPNSTLAKNIVCQLELKQFFGHVKDYLSLWQRYTMDATIFYDDGSTSATAPFNNFWGGHFHTDPSQYSSDKGLIHFIAYKPTTPMDIQDLYNVPPPSNPNTMTYPKRGTRAEELKGGGLPGAPVLGPVAQGVVEFSYTDEPGKGFNTSDLELFMKNLTIPYFNLSADLHTINGLSNVYQGETSLDMELIMGINPGIKTYLYNVVYGTNTSCAEYDCAFLNFLSDILDATESASTSSQPASVWSISYGGPEDGMPIDTLEQRFLALAKSGVTVVASSGDSGAGWEHGVEMALVAEFPSTAPSVLGAGATAIVSDRINGGADGLTEIVCSDSDLNIITSGGGFSPNYELHPYQKEAVEAYTGQYRASLKARNVYEGLIDRQFPLMKQATPDLSALGANILVILNQKHSLMFGTSASSPILAALITRINIARLNEKMTTMPLFNEFAYFAHSNKSSSIVDVTRGTNCAGEYSSAISGFLDSYNDSFCFNSSAGWDPVSGLGVLNFPDFLQVAIELWSPVVAASKNTTGSPTAAPFSRPKSAVVMGIILAVGVGIAVFVVVGIIVISRKAKATRSADEGDFATEAQSPLQPRESTVADGRSTGGGDGDYNLYSDS